MDAREIELPVVDLGRRPPIHPEMTVRQVVAEDHGCREVFRRHGESEGCPTRFGHLEPLDRFARRHGVPLDALLAELSSAGRDVLIGVLGGFAWSLAPEHWGLAEPARAWRASPACFAGATPCTAGPTMGPDGRPDRSVVYRSGFQFDLGRSPRLLIGWKDRGLRFLRQADEPHTVLLERR